MNEAHGHIARRAGPAAGRTFLTLLDRPEDVRIVWVDEALTRDAITHWIAPFADKTYSLVDAVSFEVMTREGIRDAFAFDLDFERAGFRLLRP